MNKKIILWWQGLKSELAGMDTRQRLDHLWTYYKWILAVLVGAICLISMAITSIRNRSMQTLLCGELVNVPVTAQGYQFLTDELFAVMDGREGKQRITVNTSIYSYGTDLDLQQFSYTTSSRVQAMVTNEELDYLMTDENGLMHFMNQDIFMDLRDFFDPVQMQMLSDSLIYLKAEGDTTGQTSIPVAVDLSNTAFAEKYLQNDTRVFFCVIANTTHMENCHAFWQYLMDVEGE